MDNNITVGELLENKEARAVLKREFPQLDNPLMRRLARGKSLGEVLEMAQGRVAPEKMESVLRELREI